MLLEEHLNRHVDPHLIGRHSHHIAQEAQAGLVIELDDGDDVMFGQLGFPGLVIHGERGHVAARYEYALRDTDKVGVTYHYREGFDQPEQTREARASVKSESGNREWTLWFVGVVPAKWRIVEVAPDYSWALADYPGRDMGWVLARDPIMDDTLYQDLVKRARDHGINARQLVRIPQVPEQVGKPGFGEPKAP